MPRRKMETVLWISADGPLSAIKDSVETKCTGGHDNLFLIMKCININPNFDQQIITPWMAVWILETSIFFRHIVHKKSECHVKKFWQIGGVRETTRVYWRSRPLTGRGERWFPAYPEIRTLGNTAPPPMYWNSVKHV